MLAFVSLIAAMLFLCVLVLLAWGLPHFIPLLVIPTTGAVILTWILSPPITSQRWRQLGKSVFSCLLFISVPLNMVAPVFTFPVGKLSGFWLRIILDTCLLLIALLLILKGQTQDQDRPAVKAYLLFLSWTVLIAVFHSPFGTGVPAVLRMGAPFGYYMLAVACLRTPEDGKRAINAIIASSLLVIPVAFYQLLSGQGLFEAEDYSRLTGPYEFMQSPPMFALYLLVILFVLYSLFSDKGQYWTKRLAGCLLIGTLTVFLLLTETRAAWAGLGVGCVVISMFRKRLKWAILVSVLPILLVVSVPTFQRRISEVGAEYFDISYRSVMAGSLGVRVATFTLMAPGVIQSPFWGHGFGSFAALFEDLYGVPKLAPHNDFLYLAFESGLIGFLLYLWYIWKLAVLAQSYARGPTIGSRVSQAALVSLIVINVFLFFHNPFFATDIQGYIFALLGISSAYLQMEKQRAGTRGLAFAGGNSRSDHGETDL